MIKLRMSAVPCCCPVRYLWVYDSSMTHFNEDKNEVPSFTVLEACKMRSAYLAKNPKYKGYYQLSN